MTNNNNYTLENLPYVFSSFQKIWQTGIHSLLRRSSHKQFIIKEELNFIYSIFSGK